PGAVRVVARSRCNGLGWLFLPGTCRMSRSMAVAMRQTGAGAPPHRRWRLLINCSNLHVGGAVAVASSFVHCLSQEPPDDFDITLLLSTAVSANLDSMRTELNGFVG